MSLINVKHQLHPEHTLKLISSAEPFRCSGCKQKGLFRCHICPKGCHFGLHDDCADPEPYAFHDLMKSCHFQFYDKPPQPDIRWCVACGKDIRGFVYQCKHKKPHDIHPHCFKLPHSKTDHQENVTVRLCKSPPKKCFRCNKKKVTPIIEGWCYVSDCGKYCCHVACVMDLCIENWKKCHLWRSGDAGNGGEKTKNDSVALEIVDPFHKAIVRWKRNGPKCSKTARVLKIIVAVFNLVVSALFGDPFTAIAVGLITASASA